MAKTKVSAKKQQRKSTRPAVRNSTLSRPRNPTFGAVSTINTAPVAIGNSMRGATPQIIHTGNDSVRVIGRDFAQTAYNSGTATNWLMVAGFPLTPNCFVSSVLRNYCQMYNKFKFNKVRLHYITSSPTSSSGDVLFQVNANRSDPVPNWTGANFLPFALSKPETIIGPQWTNHTMEIVPKGPARTLDLGQNNDTDYQAQGEVFLYSKTSSTDSPGYLMIDYDISFFEQSINPKQGLLPNPNLLFFPIQLTFPTTALTANTTAIALSAGTRGSGGTAITALTSTTAYKQGDIYKIALDLTGTNASAWTVSAGTIPTAANLLAQSAAAGTQAITIADGYTLYALVESSSNVTLYANMPEAFTAALRLVAGQTYTPNVYGESASVPNAGVWLMGFASYIGSINPGSLQQQ